MCLVRCRGCRRMPVEQCPTGKLHNRPPPYLRVFRYRRQPLSLFPRLFILCVRQGCSILAEDMSWTNCCIGYVYMRVTGSAKHGSRCRCHQMYLSYHIAFFLFPYFIGSFTPSTTPARSTSAPFIITSLFTCQYSVHPARST